jgi:hypothetical protein
MREYGINPEEVEKNKKPYQAIVVMPYSSGEYVWGRRSKISPNFGITYESKLSALAAY